MKKTILNNFAFLSTLVFFFACEKKSSHQSFLGAPTEEVSSNDDKKTEEQNSKVDAEGKKDSLNEKDHINVTGAEWEAAKGEGRTCLADLSALKSESKLMEEAAYARGEKSCKERDAQTKEDITKKVFAEFETVIDEIRTKLLNYRLSYVIVNGECEALEASGQVRMYVLKEDRCLNVVNKKVGNDGEISGIIGAVSPEAVKEGILSLNCDKGKASLKFIEKRCDSAIGTGAGAGKIELKK